jgi:bifunctional DNA-binding transcriptional regulator/antitoxin component of YhaV-PrlF toxin-antitoxin module
MLLRMKQARISRGGQVSIPADVRHRWKTDRIMIEDRGDQVIVRPLPDDPIAAARGSLRPFAAEDAITSDAARARTRAEEAASGPGAIR